ncbi:hypothetical protein EV122DRAFT_214842 [Schizophyllum commune]
MSLDSAEQFEQRITEAIEETNPRKQATLLDPLRQPHAWLRAFRSLSPDYIPQTTSSPVDERIAGVLNDLQILAMILMPGPQTPASAHVLRVLLVGFRTMWPLAWSWVQFLDPLSDGPRSDGMTRLVISATIPSVLAMGLRLALKETENRTQIVASMRDEPLQRLVALWYHDFGIDHSDLAMQKDLERDNDQGLCLQIRHAQGAIGEIIADSASEYYDSMVRALYKISGGHPGRLRRRMLANLERGLHSRQRLSEMDVAQLYLAPISYLLSIPSYTFPPLSSRTIRKQAELLLELSLSPDTAPRAVGMCSVISSLHRKELSGRVMAVSMSSGLLTGLRNIIAQQPFVRALREGDGAKVVMALIITLIVTLRLRRVARSLVHTDVLPVSREEMLEPKSLLVKRWENLMGRKRLHAQAWAAHKERLKHARRCFNTKVSSRSRRAHNSSRTLISSQCTTRPVVVRRCFCQEAYYCSKECQRTDWRLQHRTDCVGERTGAVLLSIDPPF